MVKKTINTEAKIIEAAKDVFVLKGHDGARMQHIADKAGINKALLHYYFRSKDKLFDRVFSDVFSEVVTGISNVLETADTLEDLLEKFVGTYIDLLKAKPYLPDFVLHELTRNPSGIVHLINTKGVNKMRLIEILSKEGSRTDIREFDPIQVIVNVIALSVFPFVAQPILTGFIFDGNKDSFNEFIDERKEHIVNFVKSAIIKTND